MDGTDWRALDREALDRAYNNSAAVPETPALFAAWEERSAALRRARPESLDIAYGPRPRNRIDFFGAGRGAPTLVFVHGGYWQMRAKETFAFVASGPLAAGIAVALVGYTLAPETSLDEMAAEVEAALDTLGRELPRLGGDPALIWLSGWSAGAHLTAMALGHPLVRGGLAVSGLYDLEPIRHTFVNEKLGLDEAAARRNSPLLHLPATSPPLAVAVGADELPLMRGQSEEFARARAERGLPGSFEALPGMNHFTILEELASPDGRLTALACDLIAGASSS